jgi:hypothetical protein
MEKRIKIKKYSKHPEMEGDKLEVTIMNNEKIKPIVKKPTTPRKPKQPKMTINQLAVIVNNLAVEMRAEFAAVNHRIDVEFAAVNKKIDKEVGEIKETLKRHEEIFARNNLK